MKKFKTKFSLLVVSGRLIDCVKYLFPTMGKVGKKTGPTFHIVAVGSLILFS